MKYCKKCILPESYPGISFNDEGICNFCLEHKSYHQNLGREKLLEVLTSRKKNGKYHCVVPISGGKDSTYILYYVVKELGLNPIAVSYDSGYQTKIANENVRKACDVLGVYLVVVKSPGNIQTNLLKESFFISKRMGKISRPCGNCEAIIRTISINTAKKYEVPFVIWGSSALESIDNKNYEKYKKLGKIPYSGIVYKLKILLNDPKMIKEVPYIGYHAAKYDFFSIAQRRALHFPLRFALSPMGIPPFSNENPKFIHFFDFLNWDSIRNIKLLEDELGWKHPEGKDSRFDCVIHSFVNIQYLKDHGITQDGVNLCNFIREGRMSREDALNREQDDVKSTEKECIELIEKMGLRGYEIP
jgi:hypothetical protein